MFEFFFAFSYLTNECEFLEAALDFIENQRSSQNLSPLTNTSANSLMSGEGSTGELVAMTQRLKEMNNPLRLL